VFVPISPKSQILFVSVSPVNDQGSSKHFSLFDVPVSQCHFQNHLNEIPS